MYVRGGIIDNGRKMIYNVFPYVRCEERRAAATGGKEKKTGKDRHGEMQTTYNPKDFEDRIYREWMEGGCFRAEIDRDKVPFTVMMPPPT